MRSLSLIVYTLLFYCLLPVFVLRLYGRSIKAPEYRRRLSERFGFFPHVDKVKANVIWVHTVSVGETIAARPLLQELLNKYSDFQLLITTTTPTGSAQVISFFSQDIDKGRVLHSYMPYDTPDAIARFIKRINPVLAVFMETEVWPNTLVCCSKKSIPTVLVNARLSEKSFQGYKRFDRLSKEAFSQFAMIAAQSQADADRISLLEGSNISVTGSIKLEITVDSQLAETAKKLKQQWSDASARKIIIAASTHKGEDEIFLRVFHGVLKDYANALLVIVPRHIERFHDVKQLCQQQGLSFVSKSENPVVSQETQVIVGDTMGELMLLYGASDIAVVGGSFVNHGGHNMLEPAAWGLPIISGSSVFNFAKISNDLVQKNAMVLADNEQQLQQKLLQILNQTVFAEKMGKQAKQYVEQNRGALEKIVQIIDKAMPREH